MIEYIQSVLLIISAILIIVSAIGLISLSNNTKNAVYARIHIVGVFMFIQNICYKNNT